MQVPASRLLPFDPAVPAPVPAGGWLDDLRADGARHFTALGLPGPKTEAWKYTALKGLDLSGMAPLGPVSLDRLPEADLPAVEAVRIVLVNGTYRPDLSDPLPDTATAMSLAEAAKAQGTRLTDHLGRIAPLSHAPFAALNTAWLEDGLVLHLTGCAVVDKPLHLIHVAAPDADPGLSHPRTLITSAPGASATILESHVGFGGKEIVSNQVTEIALAANTALRHVLVQNLPSDAVRIAKTAVDIARSAHYEGFVLQLGGRLTRQEVDIVLNGAYAEARLNGAYLPDSGQHMDLTTTVSHTVPDTASGQLVKGVLSGSGRGVYQGRISVHRDAQRTDGRQMHKALLLSPKAEVDYKPELEIYADDVQCAHGATTGALDPDQIFYLLSRGIDMSTARALLIDAFLADVLDTIESGTLRAALSDMAHARLRAGSAMFGNPMSDNPIFGEIPAGETEV